MACLETYKRADDGSKNARGKKRILEKFEHHRSHHLMPSTTSAHSHSLTLTTHLLDVNNQDIKTHFLTLDSESQP